MVVEDDEVIREELKIFLNKYGYEVTAPEQFENIIELILNSDVDLLLLDINLPIYDGYYICREIRRESQMPIIIVTSRNSDMDELMSMNLGADDFITKPYNTQILLARVSALLRRAGGSEVTDNILIYNELKLNLSNATIIYQEKEAELTKNEVKILSYLIKNRGSIVSRQALMEYLWQSDYFVDDSTLSVNITRLRKKLDKIGLKDIIETRRGLGYLLV